MPERMEKALKAAAAKRGLKGRRAAAFVYGTMRKHGWTPQVTWTRTKKVKKKKKR